MGDRRNIIITDGSGGPNVALYTHWAGTELPKVLARALERGRSRWGDTPYLTRIIFSDMISENHDVLETTGFGISATDDLTSSVEPSERDIIVNDGALTVTIGGVEYTYKDYCGLGAAELVD